jgi:predicted lipoprotein with Yx(FWY)xxD motif
MKAPVPHRLLGPLTLAGALLVSGCTTVVRDPVAMPAADSAANTQTGAPPQPGAANQRNDLGQRSPDGGYWPASVQLGEHPELGPVVLDGQGFTLYRFDHDSAAPPQSNCTQQCLTAWLPVLVNEKVSFKDLDPARLGAVPRSDGTRQVTVGGRPVYRFVDDRVPGQAAGQGTDGLWFVIAPDGGKAAAPIGQESKSSPR